MVHKLYPNKLIQCLKSWIKTKIAPLLGFHTSFLRIEPMVLFTHEHKDLMYKDIHDFFCGEVIPIAVG